jgi:hypothetical protein
MNSSKNLGDSIMLWHRGHALNIWGDTEESGIGFKGRYSTTDTKEDIGLKDTENNKWLQVEIVQIHGKVFGNGRKFP